MLINNLNILTCQSLHNKVDHPCFLKHRIKMLVSRQKKSKKVSISHQSCDHYQSDYSAMGEICVEVHKFCLRNHRGSSSPLSLSSSMGSCSFSIITIVPRHMPSGHFILTIVPLRGVLPFQNFRSAMPTTFVLSSLSEWTRQSLLPSIVSLYIFKEREKR